MAMPTGGQVHEAQESFGRTDPAFVEVTNDIYVDADEALDEAASVLQRFADEALQWTLGTSDRHSYSSEESLSTAPAGPLDMLVNPVMGAELRQEQVSDEGSTHASWGISGQLSELLQDAEEAAADPPMSTGPDVVSPDGAVSLARIGSFVLEQADILQPDSAHVAPESPSMGHLWRLGEAAAAGLLTSSDSGSDAQSAVSVDILQQERDYHLNVPSSGKSKPLPAHDNIAQLNISYDHASPASEGSQPFPTNLDSARLAGSHGDLPASERTQSLSTTIDIQQPAQCSDHRMSAFDRNPSLATIGEPALGSDHDLPACEGIQSPPARAGTQQPADSSDRDLPACQRSQSPEMLRSLPRFPASPGPVEYGQQQVLHQEPTSEVTSQPLLHWETSAKLKMLSNLDELIELPSLTPPSPLLPKARTPEPEELREPLQQLEDERLESTQSGHVEEPTAHPVGDSLEGRCITSDGGNESIEALELGSSTLGDQQAESSPLPDEACSTSDSDQSSLAEQILQVRLSSPQHAAAVTHAARCHAVLFQQPAPMQKQQQPAKGQLVAASSVPLPQELASMQDIADGLQLSQQFNMTSQLLMRQIATMRDSLAVFSAGTVHDTSPSRADGEQAAVGKAVEPEPLQDLPAFLNGLRAKYGLTDSRPLLLHSVASAPAPQPDADAGCTVKQVPAEQITDPKPDSMQSCEFTEGTLSDNDVPPRGQDHQDAAPAQSVGGVASSAQMEIPKPALASGQALHEAECPSSSTEESAAAVYDLSDQPALQTSYRRNSDPAVSIPQLRQLSHLLSQNGFPALHDEDMAEERLSAVLFDALTSVLREYERRSHLAEELLAAIEQTRTRDKDVDADLQRLREEHERDLKRAEAAAGRMKREAEEWRRAAAQQEAAVKKLESDLARLSRELNEADQQNRELRASKEELKERASHYEADLREARQCHAEVQERVRAAERRAGHARQALVQAEHSSRAHEAAAQKLRERLAAKVRAEEWRLQRDADAHSRIKAALASHKGDGRAKSAAGAVSAAVREMRPLEIVGVYESQREALEMELAVLRAEMRTLQEQLRDAQNLLAIQEGGRPTALSNNAPRRVAVMTKAVTEAQGALAKERAAAAEAARTAARKVAEAERRAEALAEENASLVLQLNARPTTKAFGSLKRQLESLERQLAHSQEASADVSLGAVRARKDRQVHQAGLDSVDELEQGVLADIVQRVCLALGAADATDAPARAADLQRALAALPRLERFVTDVCEVVFRRGKHLTQEAQEDTAAVPLILERWVDAQQAAREATHMKHALEHLLRPHLGNDADASPGCEEIIACVGELVEQEQGRCQAAQSVAAAEGLVQANAEALLHRIVAHFQHLFAIDDLEGVLPAMNQVYVAYTEGQNVRRAMAEILGLEATASIGSCMQCLTQLISTHNTKLGETASDASEPDEQPAPVH
ncbi:hypothetical protein COCOBI_02-4140 [Coccomyxa sp. Obi]|nr:hypothetical protein COCOBI_02-4140 [Coccomyxa sp. Obi]